MHLTKPEFPGSACVSLTKDRERTQKFRETENLKHLYGKKLEKACFPHDEVFSDTKELAKRTIWDRILKDTAYEIASNCNYDGVYKFFDKKAALWRSVNEQLAEEFHKPVIKKFKRRKVCARFKGNIWTEDLSEMESLSSKNENESKYNKIIIKI